MSWYFTLLLCGLFLVGAEIFVPGGILGCCGAAALIAAVVIGFNIFPPVLGWLSLLLILALSAAAVYGWMKFFPKSRVGRALSLEKNITAKDQDDSPWSAGMKGVTTTPLRPAGKAVIESRRADVITTGAWIDQDAAIEIIRVEGNRIYVRQI